MRQRLEPRLVDASGGEPGLVVDLRDERRALLFDLGDLARLPPRVLLRVSHGFVTHTHMDHFAGFDHLLAVGLGRMERLVLWGGPG
ncbi:MAG TPA: ribonuclease Z, partial [Ideonella sp.]|nr:ribonuclease Z [Ideonella sp.]